MEIGLIFKIAAIGVLVAVITMLLKQSGRDDMAMIAALAGLIIAITLIINVIADLFDSLRRVFNLF
ncbi:MAG TPA: stage III sporulation protein AC [Clostridiales bacterium]|nr:stage III sporulation protein AC [Clostridiales bacterium]